MLTKEDILYVMPGQKNVNEDLLEKVVIDSFTVELQPDGTNLRTAQITNFWFNAGRELRSEEQMTVPFEAVKGILQD